jgi:hypothetical protein
VRALNQTKVTTTPMDTATRSAIGTMTWRSSLPREVAMDFLNAMRPLKERNRAFVSAIP